jgi:hypothetical protein
MARAKCRVGSAHRNAVYIGIGWRQHGDGEDEQTLL